MAVRDEIEAYIAGQAPPKRGELEDLHRRILARAPGCKLWFLDGRNEDGKVVSNPSVGYGSVLLRYAGGETREFYRIGLSANTAGISVYVMGLEDKRRLADSFGARLGKAKVTGYCIKFRSLKDVDAETLDEIFATFMAGAPETAA